MTNRYGKALLVLVSLGATAANAAPGVNDQEGFSFVPQGFQIETARDAFRALKSSDAVQDILMKDQGLSTFSLDQMVTNPQTNVQTVKFQHYFKGLEVYGSLASQHKGAAGVQLQDNLARFDVDTTPSFSPQQAILIAKATSGDRLINKAPELKILPSTSKDARGSARLTYWISFANSPTQAGEDVIVDAHSGEVIASISKHISLAPIQVFSAEKQGVALAEGQSNQCKVLDMATNQVKVVSIQECQKMIEANALCQILDGTDGSPFTLNPKVCKQVVVNGRPMQGADRTAQLARNNAQTVLRYYSQVHRRDSFDNKGSDSINIVHAGINFANAFWVSDENYMAYGDGDGELGNLAAALDVAGHEMTHGVTAHTAKLLYMDESGALNEAYSDFFGKAIENKGDWLVGRGLFAADPNKGIRDMKNPASITGTVLDQNGRPTRRPYPAKISEKAKAFGECNSKNDYCYVHFNATIPGHASYLVSEAIGPQKAQALYYLVLTQYLTPQSNFETAASDTLKACAQALDSSSCAKVKAAFQSVGLQ